MWGGKMDVLEGYTSEEIEELARKHIEYQKKEGKELRLKISKIDKNYRKHNERAVIRAITNGTMIIGLSAVLMKSNINISEFGNDTITELINQSYEWINQLTDNIPMGDMVSTIYAKIMGILETAVDKVGIIGIVLANRAVSFVTDTVKDGVKTIKTKKEINMLKDKLHELDELKKEECSK